MLALYQYSDYSVYANYGNGDYEEGYANGCGYLDGFGEDYGYDYGSALSLEIPWSITC